MLLPVVPLMKLWQSKTAYTTRHFLKSAKGKDLWQDCLLVWTAEPYPITSSREWTDTEHSQVPVQKTDARESAHTALHGKWSCTGERECIEDADWQ